MGSESITSRTLIIAALSSTPSVIYDALRSCNTDLMVHALQALGTDISAGSTYPGAPNHTLRVTPRMLRGGIVECSLASTVMYFVSPIAALVQGSVFFEGDVEAKARPVSAVLDALHSLGVSITDNEPPFTVDPQGPDQGNRLGDSIQEQDLPDIGGEVEIDASTSSQFVSGLLLSAPRYGRGPVLRPTGRIPSRPRIDITLDMLHEAGVQIEKIMADTPEGPRTTFSVHPIEMIGRIWQVEPDLPNTAALLAAATVTSSSVTMPGWPKHTTQPGDRIHEIFTAIGATVTFNRYRGNRANLAVVDPRPSELRGIAMGMSEIDELTPTIAAITALATIHTELMDIAHLRGHETNRLTTLTAEINSLGGRTIELDDGIATDPVPLHDGLWRSYADHRVITAGAVVGLRTEGVEVENIGTTAKTIPGFDLYWLEVLRLASPNPSSLEKSAEARLDDVDNGAEAEK